MAAAQEVGTPQTNEVESAPAPTLVRLDPQHAKDLRWYFGENLIAGVAVASDMGIMLERAAIMAIRLVPCRACGGDDKQDKPGTGNRPRWGGSYEAALRRYTKGVAKEKGLRWMPTVEVAKGWRDLGIKNVVASEEIAAELPYKLTKHCLSCEGTGMKERRRNNRVGAVTARPTGSSMHGNPDAMHAISVVGLKRWGRVNRQLEEVCEQSARARVALQMYYGPNGGSISCLWELTESGNRFLETTENLRKLTPEQRMQNFRNEQAAEPTSEGTKLLSGIARECAEVWDHACATWVDLHFEVVNDLLDDVAEAFEQP
jgi:hypothetical protein